MEENVNSWWAGRPFTSSRMKPRSDQSGENGCENSRGPEGCCGGTSCLCHTEITHELVSVGTLCAHHLAVSTLFTGGNGLACGPREAAHVSSAGGTSSIIQIESSGTADALCLLVVAFDADVRSVLHGPREAALARRTDSAKAIVELVPGLACGAHAVRTGVAPRNRFRRASSRAAHALGTGNTSIPIEIIPGGTSSAFGLVITALSTYARSVLRGPSRAAHVLGTGNTSISIEVIPSGTPSAFGLVIAALSTDAYSVLRGPSRATLSNRAGNTNIPIEVIPGRTASADRLIVQAEFAYFILALCASGRTTTFFSALHESSPVEIIPSVGTETDRIIIRRLALVASIPYHSI